MSDGVNVTKAGDILEVTIDRPKPKDIDLAASRRLNDVFNSFRDDASLKIATITSAVNGIPCGCGFEVVLGTDIIVMEEHAKFALPEINVGVLADAGTVKLRRRIPYHIAVEFLLTGRWMDAAASRCRH